MLSLYIHVPFCVRKCNYCGFYSTGYSSQSADHYLSALRIEATGYQQAFSRRVFDSVYIGGGTPTVLALEQSERLMGVVNEHFQIARDAEYTIEANPNTVTGPQLMELQERGINRLSLGIQSFSDDLLKILGRLHTAQEAADAFMLARNAGFRNIGVDLIYGIPGQTTTKWKETLDRALALKPEHVSAYSLSLDEGSWFLDEVEAGRIAMPPTDSAADMYELAVVKLGDSGYENYEISNFCLPGFSCRHNRNYWDRGEYLGLGPGAWSFIEGRRYRTVADVREYAMRLTEGMTVVDCEEIVVPRQAANETVMLGLRTSQGVDLVRYEQTYGADALRQLQYNAAPLKLADLLTEMGGRLRLTRGGAFIINEVLARLSL